jgi:hypothetical protein
MLKFVISLFIWFLQYHIVIAAENNFNSWYHDILIKKAQLIEREVGRLRLSEVSERITEANYKNFMLPVKVTSDRVTQPNSAQLTPAWTHATNPKVDRMDSQELCGALAGIYALVDKRFPNAGGALWNIAQEFKLEKLGGRKFREEHKFFPDLIKTRAGECYVVASTYGQVLTKIINLRYNTSFSDWEAYLLWLGEADPDDIP